ncbi:MAG: hypothetical protein QM820_43435 [Minicystis sp.]
MMTSARVLLPWLVVHARAFHVPAAQLDLAGHVQLEAFQRVARHGELHHVRAAIGFGHGLVVRRLGEEAGLADLAQVDDAVGIDLADRVDHAGDARRTLLVGRQPARHLAVDALEAGRDRPCIRPSAA